MTATPWTVHVDTIGLGEGVGETQIYIHDALGQMIMNAFVCWNEPIELMVGLFTDIAEAVNAHDRLQTEHEKVAAFGDVFEDHIGNVASANQQDRERALDALWDAWHAVKEARGE